MENQYNYYHSEEPQNDSSYSSQPNPEHHENQKEDAKGRCGDRMRVAVRSGFKCHILTTNVVGNKVLGLDQKAAKKYLIQHRIKRH